MKKYNKINTISGWIIFVIASIVYLATIEPTASFWDPGEFISAAFKLEVGHPPGAPLFMILGRVFTFFAGGDVSQVAKMVNSLSALMSSFTILFLFWSITHLARKIIIKDEGSLTTANIIAIIASGAIGALAYTFSDSFWFSAVEGEVYATSSLFTALVFWAILKWENIADEPHSIRWIILIAYLMGLSIGIHLLNLLAIPAIVLVYYFKRNPLTVSGTFKALAVSALVLLIAMYIIIPGFIRLASLFELLFVNSFGLPYWSGAIFYLIALGAGIFWAISYTHRNNKVLLNTIIVSVTVFILGYSSYGMTVIRSLADPPMDQNNPENPFALLGYLNREQYGDRPLFMGQYFNAPTLSQKEGKPVYSAINGRYEKTSNKIKTTFDPDFTTLFPRMWSSEPDHIDAYLRWANIKESEVFEPQMTQNGDVARDRQGKIIYDRTKPKDSPSFAKNVVFFVRYQLVHMYFRYFMWNFAGRQNDMQAQFSEDINKGNWISGIKFIDRIRLGNQDKLPSSQLNNPARNTYYFLPLLLGILGMIFLYKKSAKDFWIVFVFFIMTGAAIVVYLNQNPIQPRERDYAFSGSFYAFAIWIGLGVFFLYDLFRKYVSANAGAVAAGAIACVVPVLMAAENWDDHDRSGRYTARDFAFNYLNSCDKNAILFTNGDNDTFPLWYAQEVEGIRTDVRVVNLSYLTADWYIEQMERKAYESEALPLTLKKDKYIQGKRDIVYLVEMIKDTTDVKLAIDFLADDNPKTKTLPNYQGRIDFIPNNKFSIPVDKDKVLSNGTVSQKFADKILPEVNWTINRRYLIKNHLMVFDLLATNNWERPIYYAITVSSENYLNLENYFQVHGLAYRIVPVKTESEYPYTGGIDVDKVYDNLINKFKWGGITDPDVYLDENILRMASNIRSSFSRLAEELIAEGKLDSAKVVMAKCEEIMPNERIPYNLFNLSLVENYFQLNEREKAIEMVEKLKQNAYEELDYLASLEDSYSNYLDYERRLNLHIVNELASITGANQVENLRQELEKKFQDYLLALKVPLY